MVQFPLHLWGPLAFSVQEEVALPSSPPYLPLQEVAPELLEVVQGQASPMLGMGHLVKLNIPRREAEFPTSPSSLNPGTAPIIYPKTLQQLLTGPEPDFSGVPSMGPGYRKKAKK